MDVSDFFVLHSAMKTHMLTNQNARTVQIILYNKLVLNSFKIDSILNTKAPIPVGINSCVVYKFSSFGCAASNGVETLKLCIYTGCRCLM